MMIIPLEFHQKCRQEGLSYKIEYSEVEDLFYLYVYDILDKSDGFMIKKCSGNMMFELAMDRFKERGDNG